ncbi:MAG: cation transporter [Clostridia bacterium]|nr:cation transporter [Clostridia bacterium]
MKIKFKIKGLDCANCAAEMEREIQALEGIESASLSFMSERLEIECDEARKDEIVEKMKKLIKDEEPEVTVEEI